MSDYNSEQAQALEMVRDYLSGPGNRKERLLEQISSYLEFRRDVDAFLDRHFSQLCNAKCYQSNVSACCSKEGVVAFFADVAVNALVSSQDQLGVLARVLARPNTGMKCVFLGDSGCLWSVKPIVCQMFLCRSAAQEVFSANPALESQWKALKSREKTFTWPDRPVLFDHLEQVFLDQGLSSPLMHLHNSPGLLRVKKNAGLIP